MVFLLLIVVLILSFSQHYLGYRHIFVPNLKALRPKINPVNSLYCKVANDYDAAAITVLEGLEPVRKRPGMYIGSTGSKGLHHLVFEVVDNSIDEALAGFCTNISVALQSDGTVMVEDNGRGIPCSIHPTTNKSALETVVCVLHAGGKFGGEESGYSVSGGLHGVGISVVNALSEKMVVEVARDDKLHRLELSRGKPVAPLTISSLAESTLKQGTRVLFKPDPEIFKTTLEFEFEKLSNRLDELAYLNPGVTISFSDARISKELVNPIKQTYRHDGGLSELVSVLCAEKTPLHPETNISISEYVKGVKVDIALQWSKDMYVENVVGFANGIRTVDGGSHIEGLKTAITRIINVLMKKASKSKDPLVSIPGEFIREGLTAVINVKVPEPEFEGQTKTRLGNPEVRQIVDSVVSDSLENIFELHPQILSSVIAKASEALEAANAAKAAREMVRKKSLLQSTVLPGKLADCASREPQETEIFIVEGDSAAGSAKQGRSRKTQAILPLRGKIINIEKAANEKVYQNTEIQALISALGLGFRGSDFDASQLRYHKIIIMTDADVDGAHIRLLLLTFFYRYQKELIQNGYVYAACPPLYKVTMGRGYSFKDERHLKKSSLLPNEKYFYDQSSLDEFLSTIDNTTLKYELQRYKGLGEMMPNQLWETTMDPTRRVLKQITIDDATAADKLLTILMSDCVAPRKEFIYNNAANFKLDDLDF